MILKTTKEFLCLWNRNGETKSSKMFPNKGWLNLWKIKTIKKETIVDTFGVKNNKPLNQLSVWATSIGLPLLLYCGAWIKAECFYHRQKLSFLAWYIYPDFGGLALEENMKCCESWNGSLEREQLSFAVFQVGGHGWNQ